MIEKSLFALPEDLTLDLKPSRAEILFELGKMKDSAPGWDELRANMWKSMSMEAKKTLCGLSNSYGRKARHHGQQSSIAQWVFAVSRRATGSS